MTGRHVAVALALGLFATYAAADNAVRRDGSSGGSSDAGSRHSSGGVRSSGSGSSGGGSGWSGSSGGSSHTLTDAQRRRPRPGTGTGGRPGGGRGGGYYGGYYPGWYPWYGSGYYGYWGSHWYPYSGYHGYYGGYPYAATAYHYGYSDRGALRTLVDQRKARVYVDGYYAGVVDDFDGLFQRLYLSPGRHEIAFKLEGYEPHRMRVYVASGSTLKVHHDMRKGSGAGTFEDLAGERDDRYARREEEDRDPELEDEAEALADRPEPAEMGRLRLLVRPDDASVYVDGQFRGSGRQAGSIELPPGRHRVEVVRPGFRTEERDVDIDPGTTREEEVELQRP